MTTATKQPPCMGDATCAHFLAVSWSPSAAVIQHGDNPEHRRTATPGEFTDGLCDDGHDVALERWIHEVMDCEGCEPEEATDDDA